MLIHAGTLAKGTMCGVRRTHQQVLFLSQLLTNCRACHARTVTKSSGRVGLTPDGYALLASGVFVEKDAETKYAMIGDKLWKSEPYEGH